VRYRAAPGLVVGGRPVYEIVHANRDSGGEIADDSREPTTEEIARRAYEISQGHDRASDEENWLRAERELRAEAAAAGEPPKLRARRVRTAASGAPKPPPRSRKKA
jgi:hypothetical protein